MSITEAYFGDRGSYDTIALRNVSRHRRCGQMMAAPFCFFRDMSWVADAWPQAACLIQMNR